MNTADAYKQKYGEDALKEMYRKMCLIREFEENIKYLYQRSLATGAMHLSVGEEACAVGTCSVLRPDDKILTSHRGHGHTIAKGANIPRMIAELMARQDGFCKGRGGSMHILDSSVGALGAQGIVGAQIPIAAGVAFSAKLRGLDYVTAAFFGDGATNIGAFHEGVNIASVMKLPVIFVCINNGYAVTTPVSYSIKAPSIAARAQAYGIEGVQADGCNVLEVCDVVSEAAEKARNGKGPTLIELKAYRWYGHFVGDPCNYRTREEERWWRENKDPIKNYGKWLVENDICTQDQIAAFVHDVKNRIQEANKFAEDSPQPGFENMANEVYYTPAEA
jgi:pyruvate dehydrogenase E1 component alpha subunit